MLDDLLASTGPSVPTLGGDFARTGVHPGPGPAGTPRLQWQFQTGGEIVASPVIGNGLVYIGSADHNLYSLEVESGRERWRYEAGSALINTASLHGDLIYATFMEEIFALDAATGDERWYASAFGHNASTPAIANDTVYVTGDTRLYAFAASTGEPRWTSDLDGVVLTGTPAIVDGIVFISCTIPGTDRVYYLALDTLTGAQLWRIERDGWWDVIPAVAGGNVYVANSDGQLRALDAATGHERWTATVGTAHVSTPVIADGVTYVSADHTLWAFDASTGSGRWRLAGAGGALTLADGILYSVPWDGELIGVDASVGTERWSVDIGGGRGAASIVGGLVITGGHDGSLRAFA